MKYFNITILFAVILLLFSACRKDELVINEDNVTPPDVTVKYEVAISGEVFNLNAEPIAGATIHLGGHIAQTDDNGIFQITGLANAEKAVLKIEKEGYFNSYPVFYPQQNVGRHVRTEMMERPLVGTVDASTKVIDIDQHQIDFTNATFINENGTAYSGPVNIYATYLDPTADNLPYFMPGDLVGINQEEEEQLLKSYGMLNVELEDNNGNEVTMEGSAEMSMQVPNTLLSEAPATIPLWYFDTDSGNWIEEGTASLSGNRYVGTVAHFTFWNCDAPFDLVRITGTVVSNNLNEVELVEVVRSNGDAGVAFLDESGWFTGFVPQNEALTLNALDHCGNVLFTTNFGPLSISTDLGELDVAGSTIQSFTISGNVVDCDLNPIMNGYVILSDGGDMHEIVYLNENGELDQTVSWCSGGDINVIGFDTESNRVSEMATYAFNENIVANNIIACEDVLIGIHISGPVVNKYMPATNTLPEADQVPGVAYTFTVIDDQDAGNKVIYTMTLISWTGNPSNPQLNITYSKQLVGTPTSLDWSYDTSDLVHEFYGDTSGSLIDLKYENVDLTVVDSNGAGTLVPGHTIRFVQLVE